jgi:hypothetical protein
MTLLLPENAGEAFGTFIQDEDTDAPIDCHNHCDHYHGEEAHCCDCNEDRPQQEPVPIQQLFEARADIYEKKRFIQGLCYDLDMI